MPQPSKTDNLKSGLLYFLIFAILTAAFIYLQKNDWFADNNIFKVVFDDVSGLSKGADVNIRGVKVGKVKKIGVNPENPQTVLVELKVKGKYDIPKDAVAAIASGGLIDGNIIIIEMKGYCTEDYCADDGDYLQGRKIGLMETYAGGGNEDETADQFSLDKMKDLFAQITDEYTNPESDNIVAESLRNMDFLETKMAGLQKEMESIQNNLNAKYEKVNANMESIQNNLDAGGKMDRIQADADLILKKLDELSIDATMTKADATMKRVGNMQTGLEMDMTNAEQTMSKAKNLMKELNDIMEEAQKGDNTVAYIMDKERFSKDLDRTMATLNQLSRDFEEKPYLFIPLKSRKRFYKKKAKKEKTEQTE